MRKRIISLFTLAIIMLAFASMPITAQASMKELSSIKIHVQLEHDGSAQITEVWTARGISGGTEFYIPLGNLDRQMKVSDLTVSDSSGTLFETVNRWNVDWSFDEKAYRCGVLSTRDGYEICWGISSMGDNVYTVSYRLTELVRTYRDGVGLAHQFVTHGISSPPREASVTIDMPGVAFSEENVNLHASGFRGDYGFEDGAIHVYTTRHFSNKHYINVFAGFSDGIFDAPTRWGSFEDLQRSATGGGAPTGWIAGGVIAAMIALLSIGVYQASRVIRLTDGSRERRPSMKSVEECRTIPFSGSIPVMSWIDGAGREHGMTGASPFEAYLVKWECSGDIIILTQEQPEQGDKKPEQTIQFTREHLQADAPEASLYALLRQAADENGIINGSKFTQWAKKNAGQMVEWREEVLEYGKTQATTSGFGETDAKGKIRLTRRGFDELCAMIGLRRFLKSIDSQNANDEQPLWGDYLVFAALFGMHKTVVPLLSNADSAYFSQVSSCSYSELLLWMSYYNSSAFLLHSAGSDSMTYGDSSGGITGGGGGGGIR